jgi:excisionase family DNA binding protein
VAKKMRMISINEAAEQCGVDHQTIRRLISDHELPAVRVGKRVIRIDPADLEHILKPV